MKISLSTVACVVLLVLLALQSTESVRYPFREYWKKVMKDKPVPQVLSELIDENTVTKDFEPKLNDRWWYHYNGKDEKSLTQEFEPKLNDRWWYHYNGKNEKSLTQEFEPKLNDRWWYHYNGKNEKSLVNEIEKPQEA